MALEEHLRKTRRPSEVAVDLKRRVGVEQVRQRGLPEQGQDIFVSDIALPQPRPEIDDPRAAPSGVAAAMGQPALERLPGGRGEFRRTCRLICVARVQPIELRDVPVPRLRLFEIL